MLFDFIELDTKKGDVLWRKIYSAVKDAAVSGVLTAGEKLPSVREAAASLKISRTTVETAYEQLCIEGIAESVPQKGYYIRNFDTYTNRKNISSKKAQAVYEYDFSSRNIDAAAADTEKWKKTVRRVLLDTKELNSYGDFRGEEGLRVALANYSYKARGVTANPENIVVGAGVGPLLNILCALLGREVKVGFENGGFKTAQAVFSDYGIKTHLLKSDNNGAKLESIKTSDIDVLFLLPSAFSKISVTSLSKRRVEFADWAKESGKIIIEDDYNGELRYTARSVPAFQSKAPENTVYIGSFSKLLLPSVRIAYMVLPFSLAQKLKQRAPDFNQTCGKIEQMALSEYITNGSLEKHLRRLRRLYYGKSQVIVGALKEKAPFCETTLYESSLILEIDTKTNLESREICSLASLEGINLLQSEKKGRVKISFAGLEKNKIDSAACALAKFFNKYC